MKRTQTKRLKTIFTPPPPKAETRTHARTDHAPQHRRHGRDLDARAAHKSARHGLVKVLVSREGSPLGGGEREARVLEGARLGFRRGVKGGGARGRLRRHPSCRERG